MDYQSFINGFITGQKLKSARGDYLGPIAWIMRSHVSQDTSTTKYSLFRMQGKNLAIETINEITGEKTIRQIGDVPYWGNTTFSVPVSYPATTIIRGTLELFYLEASWRGAWVSNYTVHSVLSAFPDNCIADLRRGAALDFIPPDLLSAPSFAEQKNFHAFFYNCQSLQTVPVSLFDSCSNAEDFSGCFESCLSLKTVPEHLFDLTKANNFETCFYGCDKLKHAPPLWERFPNANGHACFSCRDADNWGDIPQNWRDR